MLQEDEKDERKLCRVVGQVRREGQRWNGRTSSSLPEYMRFNNEVERWVCFGVSYMLFEGNDGRVAT